MLSDLIRNYSSSIDYREFLIYMILTAILSLGLSLVYIYTAESRRSVRSLARLIPIISLTIALLGTVLSSSAAIAIGLVGALSVVRYRTRLDDLEGITFLFLAIAIGLSCSTHQPFTALFGLLIISGILFLRRALRPRRHTTPFLLHIKGGTGSGKGLIRLLKASNPGVKLVHFKKDDSEEEWLFAIQFRDPSELQTLKELVIGHHPTFMISLVDGSENV